MPDTVMYEYRCVAGPTVIAVKKQEERAQAVSEFENIINQEAADGWEYVGIDEFQTAEPPGCMGGKAFPPAATRQSGFLLSWTA
jgi:hypothetical protein